MFDAPIPDPTRPATPPRAARPWHRIALALAVLAVVVAIQGVVLALRAGELLASGDLVPVGIAIAGAVAVLFAGGAAPGTPFVALLALASCLGPTAGRAPLARWLSERALGGWIDGEELAAIEREHGYFGTYTEHLPQVSRRAGGDELSRWIARESDRAPGTTPLGPDARGVAVRIDEGGALVLDDAQLHLGARAARSVDEIAWVALLWRSEPIMMSYDNGLDTIAERVDVRLFDRAAGAVVARASIGAVPPARTTLVASRCIVPSDAVARVIVSALDDDRVAAREPAPAWDSEGCEAAVELSAAQPPTPLACIEGVTAECIAACRRGDAAACRDAGYTLEHASSERARPYYALACRAGSANACTNFAASLLVDVRDDPEAHACARRLFERTCEVGEHFGCGMLGSMLARGQGGVEDDERARSLLVEGCDAGNAFACDKLGEVISSGDLVVEGRDASALRERACTLGRVEACVARGGTGATVAE